MNKCLKVCLANKVLSRVGRSCGKGNARNTILCSVTGFSLSCRCHWQNHVLNGCENGQNSFRQVSGVSCDLSGVSCDLPGVSSELSGVSCSVSATHVKYLDSLSWQLARQCKRQKTHGHKQCFIRPFDCDFCSESCYVQKVARCFGNWTRAMPFTPFFLARRA